MIDKTFIVYESFDAEKLLELKIPENSTILPITPNAFNILRESNLNCKIINPIDIDIDPIHKKIIEKLDTFYKLITKKNLKENNYLQYSILQIYSLLISISNYLYFFLPKNKTYSILIENKWKTFYTFEDLHYFFIKEISKIHKLPSIKIKYNFIQNYILLLLLNIQIFFINKNSNFLFTGNRYGLKNLKYNLLK